MNPYEPTEQLPIYCRDLRHPHAYQEPYSRETPLQSDSQSSYCGDHNSFIFDPSELAATDTYTTPSGNPSLPTQGDFRGEATTLPSASTENGMPSQPVDLNILLSMTTSCNECTPSHYSYRGQYPGPQYPIMGKDYPTSKPPTNGRQKRDVQCESGNVGRRISGQTPNTPPVQVSIQQIITHLGEGWEQVFWPLTERGCTNVWAGLFPYQSIKTGEKWKDKHKGCAVFLQISAETKINWWDLDFLKRQSNMLGEQATPSALPFTVTQESTNIAGPQIEKSRVRQRSDIIQSEVQTADIQSLLERISRLEKAFEEHLNKHQTTY